MKIGLVRRGYSATGGAENYLQRFASALASAGHQPILFAAPGWPVESWEFGEIQTIAGTTPAAFARALRERHPERICDRLFSLERIFECDCYRAGDGVHKAWLERRARFEPKIETWFRLLRRSHREILSLEEHLFRTKGARQVIANSNLVRDEIVRLFDYPADRIHVVYNGVPPAPGPDERRQLRQAARERLGLRPETVVLLFLGSGWERKGLRFALDAMKGAKDLPILLLVAGRGNSKLYRHNPKVCFLGPTSAPHELLAAADIFLLPTLYDPFSNASLEAHSFGLPVITTRDNGFSELLEPGETGEILPDPADTEAMIEAITAWMPEEKRAALQPIATSQAAAFTMERNLRETLQVLLTDSRN